MATAMPAPAGHIAGNRVLPWSELMPLPLTPRIPTPIIPLFGCGVEQSGSSSGS
jgi:hypothetical protein